MATISKNNIGTGNTIQAEHITRIIDALNGTGSADIIATGSFTGSFKGYSPELTVLDLTVNGTASINYFETIYETSSIIYQSGSTKFGNSADDTHQFTGSVFIDGDSVSTGTTIATGSFSGSFVGDGSGLDGVLATTLFALSEGSGISAFSFDGSSTQIINISGSTGLTADTVTKWTGGAFANTSITDNGSVVDINSDTTITGSVAVHNGNVNIEDNSYFFQGSSVGGSNVSLIGVNNQDQIYIGNQGYDNIIADNTTISGSLKVTDVTLGAGTDTVAMYDTGSGQFYYTSSAAIGGGGAGFPFSGSAVITGSLVISGSESPALAVYGSGSTVFTVNGVSGEIFSVSDSLSGSLFAVNNEFAQPILEVFSDDTVLIGDSLAPALNTTVITSPSVTGSFTVYSLPTASYDAAFFEYIARSGSDARAGQIMSLWSGSSVNFTETTTTDFGNTSALAFTVAVTGSNFALTGSVTTAGWSIKTIVRSI